MHGRPILLGHGPIPSGHRMCMAALCREDTTSACPAYTVRAKLRANAHWKHMQTRGKRGLVRGEATGKQGGSDSLGRGSKVFDMSKCRTVAIASGKQSDRVASL